MAKAPEPFPTEQALIVKPTDVSTETPARRMTYTWICQYCGQPFETTVYSQRYCNRTHREYAYRERKRESVDTLSVNKNSP